MASSRLFINEKHLKKNGETPIYALVQINNKTLQINTGVCVDPANFDIKKKRIKGTGKNVIDKNLIIDKVLSDINEIFVRYRLQGKKLTPELFKREYDNPGLYVNFYLFLDKTIKEREKNSEITESSAKQHRVVLNKLQEYRSELSFSEIDVDFITDFARHLKKKLKNDTNTVNKNLSNLRIYLNIARKKGIIKSNPFEQFRMKNVRGEITFLTESELRKLWEIYNTGHRLPDSHQRTLRHFLFMCFTGLRISDFKLLRKTNLEGKTLHFIPFKTRKEKQIEIQFELIPKAIQLIDDENSQTPFLFDTISEQKMNEQIKEIAKMDNVRIRKNLTNHVARHTFATNFIEKTNDVASLQKILGHSSITETMIYVHVSNSKINQQMSNFGNSFTW